MKSTAINELRRKLAANEATYGLWVTLESPSITEMAVGLGLDWIVIDAEHGHLDWNDIVAHIRATVRSNTVALVRLADLSIGLVKRALDIGADGVVIPWMESAEQVRLAVSYAHYPPGGLRGIGGERSTCWGGAFQESIDEANANVLVVPIIESVKGGRNIESICAEPGVEFFFLGPADFSSTAGYPGQWQGPGVAEELLRIKDVMKRHGKHCGLVTTGPQDLTERREQGFSLLALGLDAGLMLRTINQALTLAGQPRQITPNLVPESAAPVQPETAELEIAPGVVFRPLLARHNQVRHITAGTVVFQPRTELPYHLHRFVESVTLLHGEAAMEVEGRRYSMLPLDNVTIPPGLIHCVVNTCDQPAILHITMATESPSRELVQNCFERMDMPRGSSTPPGAEQVTLQPLP